MLPRNWKSFAVPYGASTNPQYSAAAAGALGGAMAARENAKGNIATTAMQEPGRAFTSYSQALAGLGSSYANNYGAYASALGNFARDQGNWASNQYGAERQAEAARQASLGSIGSAALGAYGSAANSALSAWAQNQTAYNKSLSEMQQASQQGLSNYGVSRNQALGNIATAYGNAGGAMAPAAQATGSTSTTNLYGSFGAGDGFGGSGLNASGVLGPIASGAYGGFGGGSSSVGMGGGSTNASFSRPEGLDGIVAGTFGGLDGARSSVMEDGVLSALMRDADIGRVQLDAQHYDSRMMPSMMMDQTLAGLMAMSRDGYDATSRGMDQYYGSIDAAEDANRDAYRTDREMYRDYLSNRPAPDYSNIFDSLTSGFVRSGDQIGSLQADINAEYGTLRNGLGGISELLAGLYASDAPLTPAEEARQQREAEMLRRQYGNQDAEALLANYRGREWAIPGDLAKAAGLRWGGSGYYNPQNPRFAAPTPRHVLAANFQSRPINPRGDLAPNPFL